MGTVNEEALAKTRAYLLQLTERSLKPNAEAIAAIIATSGIAVVLYPPDADIPDHFATILRDMGRVDDERVFRMTSACAKRMAANIGADHSADKVTPRWLLKKRPGRIFVLDVVGGGSLLVNFTPGVGLSLEPGQSDRDWKS